MLSVLSKIDVVVESDRDYHIYLRLSKIMDIARFMMSAREDSIGEYREIEERACEICRRYNKDKLIRYIDSNISHVLCPNWSPPHSLRRIIVERMRQISDKSME